MVKPSDVPYVAHSHITILEYKRTPTPVLDDNLYNIASAGTEEGIVIWQASRLPNASHVLLGLPQPSNPLQDDSPNKLLARFH